MWRARVEAHDGPMFNSYEMTRALVAERQETLRHEARQHRLGAAHPPHPPGPPGLGTTPRPAWPARRRRAAARLSRPRLRTIDDVLVGRGGLSPVMVGREADLGRLRSLFGASPAPTIALIAGEAGIGKTRLVQELVASAPPGTLVLAGQADPGTVGRPMELFLDALGKTDVSGSPDCAAVVKDPSLSAEERVRAAVDLVRSLSEGGPGLVVFEDLHWADAESLSTFELLAEPDRGPLVLVGTYRPDGLSRRHPAADLLPRLDRRHLVTHVQLGRLGPAEVNEFLAAVFEEDPPYRAVEALHSRTGGNPFFLEELVAGAGDMSSEDLASAPLPWTVAEAVRRQVDGLDPEVRAVVSAMSVLGRRVAFDLLAAVTGEDEDVLIDAPPHRRRRRADRRGRRRRVQLPPRPRPRGDRGRAARTRAPAPPRGGARRHAGRAAATTTSPSRTTPRAPVATTRWWPRPASAPRRRCGSAPPTRRCSSPRPGCARPTTTSTCAPSPPRRPPWSGLLDDAAEHGDQWLAHARAAGRRHPRGPRPQPAHAHRVRHGRPARPWRASPTSSSPPSTRCRPTRTAPGR